MKASFKPALTGLSAVYSALRAPIYVLVLFVVSQSALAANFAGTYSGTFSGEDAGTWSVTITQSGGVSGSGHSNGLGVSFSVTGQVTAQGALTMGSVTAGANFYGTINPANGATSGSWSDGTSGGNFSGAGVITPTPVSTPSTATSAPIVRTVDGPSILAWAEAQYPQYFHGTIEDGTYDAYTYRHYRSTGNYIGIANGSVYLVGTLTNGEVLFVGTLASFICQVYPNCGVITTVPVGRYATQGPMHELVKTMGYTGGRGTVMLYTHNADGTTGGLFQRTTDECSVQINADGSATYTSGGQARKYNYEDTVGAGITSSSTVAKLYPFDTSVNSADTTAYIEFDKAWGSFRLVKDGAPLEQYCGGTSLYDIAGRFPAVDGRASLNQGTYVGRADVPFGRQSPAAPLPSYVKASASCNATINPLGQITVTIGGVTLPVFFTTDLNLDQSVMRTMFSDYPLLHPANTYTLQYGASQSATGFAFMLGFAPLTYYDSANPSFISDWSVACATTRQ